MMTATTAKAATPAPTSSAMQASDVVRKYLDKMNQNKELA